ncbi:MAG: PEGA domain-containing protein [Bacteroidales bacterium]|nr:PEGA domain-containing protein [Bacteroidales bacterium]
MKRILLVLFAFISLNAFSQLQVKEGSFKHIPGGVIEDKAEYVDGNEMPMALIKISTENIPEQERLRLVFSGNRETQILKRPKTGQMWIYLSAEAATFIDIKHPDYGTYKYYLPEKLCDYCVYEMVLQYITSGMSSVVTQQNNYLTIIADQPNASIYIDEQYVSDGFKSLAIGTMHTWKIECDMYHTESGSVTITSGEPVTIEKQLRPAYGFINVTSKPESGAIVFIDNKKVGTTPYQSDKMASGTYKVRVVKDMYKAAEQTYTITDGNTTNAVMEMNANFVNLTLDTDAASDIYIDGQYKGKGKWNGRITDGAHFVEVKKDKHRTVSKNLNLVLGKDENIKIEAPTAITGFLDISSLPVKANVYLNGKHYGTTPRIISDLMIGEYSLKLEKEGCASITKNIVIEENQTLTIKE